jgi:hypothetical protein
VIASPRQLSMPAPCGVPRILWLRLTLPGVWLGARCAVMEPQPALGARSPCPAFRTRPSAAISGRFPSRDEVNLDAAYRGPRPILGRRARPRANQRRYSADAPRSRGSIGSSQRQGRRAAVDDAIVAQSRLASLAGPLLKAGDQRQP